MADPSSPGDYVFCHVLCPVFALKNIWRSFLSVRSIILLCFTVGNWRRKNKITQCNGPVNYHLFSCEFTIYWSLYKFMFLQISEILWHAVSFLNCRNRNLPTVSADKGLLRYSSSAIANQNAIPDGADMAGTIAAEAVFCGQGLLRFFCLLVPSRYLYFKRRMYRQVKPIAESWTAPVFVRAACGFSMLPTKL